MLDTNIVSDLVRNPAGKVAKKIRKVGVDAICISVITAAKLRFGCAKRGLPRLTYAVDQLLGELNSLPFDDPAAIEYAAIRWSLEQAGKPIGPNDLLIAAHARALGMVLVTANAKEFNRVPGLQVDNWLA
jgi:tRNA(fMet)-specific endonuclease VapC